MNTKDVHDYFLSSSPWVNVETTVDTVKAGDPTKEINVVAVGWMATMQNLYAAHQLGCDLFITHEPTFWEHTVTESGFRSVEPGISKTRFLQQTGMVVLRLHDSWDNWPEIGIRDSWARGLGLTQFIAEDKTRWHAVYQIEETTLAEFAKYIASRVRVLGEDSVRVMGNPAMRVSRPSLGVGCGGPDLDMFRLGSDVFIVCYDGASYWAARERFFELGVAVIVLEHGTTEMWGMESLACHLRTVFPCLDIHYLAEHPRPWTVCAGGIARGK